MSDLLPPSSPSVLAVLLALGLLLLIVGARPLHAQQRAIPDSVREALYARDLAPEQARRGVRTLGIDLSAPQQARARGVPEARAQALLRAVGHGGVPDSTTRRGTAPAKQPTVPPPADDSYVVGPGDELRLVMLASRLVWHKGIGAFVDAARHRQRNGTQARFVVVRESDPESTASIPEGTTQTWDDAGLIDWWGYQHSIRMPQVLRQAHIVCLPSYYRESVPEVLIEAASTERSIVKIDVPGCRKIVQDQSLQQTMGTAGWQGERNSFTADRDATLATNVYGQLLQNAS